MKAQRNASWLDRHLASLLALANFVYMKLARWGYQWSPYKTT